MADKKAVEKRNFYKEKISKIGKDINDEESFKNFSVYELNELWAVLSATHDKFEIKCLALSYDDELDSDEQEQIDQENASVDQLCIKIKAKICERIDQIKSGVMEDSKAEKIKDPESEKALESGKKCEVKNNWGMFDGKFGAFSKFYENFISAMGKLSDLPDEKKLNLLSQALHGEAKYAIANSTYEQAMANLNGIYGSSYRQIQYHMHKLVNVKPVLVASANNLQVFYDEITECEQQIKRCLPESDHVLTFLLIEKLDKETSRAWERHRLCLAEEASSISREKGNHLPSFDNFKAFLKSEIIMWLGEESKTCSETNKWDVEAFGQNKKSVPSFLQCKLCEGIHPVYKCLVFKAMKLGEKEELVLKNNWCVKCLQPAHLGKCRDDLSNNACPKCAPTTFHNSILCPKNIANVSKQISTEVRATVECDEWE